MCGSVARVFAHSRNRHCNFNLSRALLQRQGFAALTKPALGAFHRTASRAGSQYTETLRVLELAIISTRNALRAGDVPRSGAPAKLKAVRLRRHVIICHKRTFHSAGDALLKYGARMLVWRSNPYLPRTVRTPI